MFSVLLNLTARARLPRARHSALRASYVTARERAHCKIQVFIMPSERISSRVIRISVRGASQKTRERVCVSVKQDGVNVYLCLFAIRSKRGFF